MIAGAVLALTLTANAGGATGEAAAAVTTGVEVMAAVVTAGAVGTAGEGGMAEALA